MKASNPGSKRGGVVREPLLLSPVLNHQVDHLYQMFSDLAHPAALDAGVGALEEHLEQVRGEDRVLETGGLAQTYDTLMLADLVLLDHAPRRMVGIGQLGEGVAERGAALLHRSEFGGGAPAPVLEQALGIADVLRGEVLPLLFLVGDDPAHPLGDEVLLRVEVAVERHFVRLRRFGDGLYADATNTVLMKQIASRHQDSLANGHTMPALRFGLGPVGVNICSHDGWLYPSLTIMLPTGNIGVITKCYRS